MSYSCPELKIHRQYTANNNMSLLHHKPQYFLNKKTTLSRSHTSIKTQKSTRSTLGLAIINTVFTCTKPYNKGFKINQLNQITAR
ncbi:hypothetical protein CWB96_16010 [Pseudoalteromonas citrea]|uniref:Uncharacterized protein n=1 Tax=Pseudoalteromonas citrea TaxID=43655 RepID=A0A5S3XL58_9GAMM|nr:hypothetical protein CWB97_21885 [Pseudoalteromonas citrea]TMP56012.1 hypothetical protein CWB96_16010 [Pseudoalteromonas citrea]